MDYEFFQSLSREQGRQFLDRYLAVESEAFQELISGMATEGIAVDFTLASLPAVFGWVLARLRTENVPPDESLEWWIRESDSYKNGLVEFDDPSSILVFRSSWYLGESFVREFDCLSWGLGDEKTMLAHMPAVRGFLHEMEMPPILVAENVMHRALRRGSGTKEIDEAIAAWLEELPA